MGDGAWHLLKSELQNPLGPPLLHCSLQLPTLALSRRGPVQQPVFFSLITIYVPDNSTTTGLCSHLSSYPKTRQATLTTVWRESGPHPRERSWLVPLVLSLAEKPSQTPPIPAPAKKLAVSHKETSEKRLLAGFPSEAVASTAHGHPHFPRGCLFCLLAFWNTVET